MQFICNDGTAGNFSTGSVRIKIVRNARIDSARKIIRQNELTVDLPDVERPMFRLNQPSHQKEKTLVHKGFVKVQDAGKIVSRSKWNQTDTNLVGKSRFEHDRKHRRHGAVTAYRDEGFRFFGRFTDLFAQTLSIRQFSRPFGIFKSHGLHNFRYKVKDDLSLATSTDRIY